MSTLEQTRSRRRDPIQARAFFDDRSRAIQSVALVDVDGRGRLVELVFGLVNVAVMLSLLLFGVFLACVALLPSAMTNQLIDHSGPLSIWRRAIVFTGAIVVLGTLKFFGSRFEDTWRWARLPVDGELFADETGVTVHHEATLATSFHVPWSQVRVISFDTGVNHDTLSHWRRFPLPHPAEFRYLFATDGPVVDRSALLTSRPAAPNMVVVLNEPVTLHNPDVHATDVAFPPAAVDGVPSRPPRQMTDVDVLFLRVDDIDAARRLVLPSSKVRALRADDI